MMVSGLTAPILEGCSLRDLILHFRGTGSSVQDDSYYVSELDANLKRVRELEVMSLSDAGACARDEHHAYVENRARIKLEHNREILKLKDMMLKVRKWEVPERLLHFRSKIIQAIQETIDWNTRSPMWDLIPGPALKTPTEWLHDARLQAKSDVRRSSDHLNKLRQSNREAAEWQALFELTLPPDTAMV